MAPLALVVTLTCSLVTLTLSMPVDEYMQARDAMLKADRSTHIGHQLSLSRKEQIVSNALLKEKAQMMEQSRQGGKDYFPSSSFYKSKHLMEQTTVFKLIHMMPKGAALHLHDQSIGSLDWLVKNVTYRDNLYMCVQKESYLMIFKFFKTQPASDKECDSWTLVKTLRSLAATPCDFDESIKRNISMLSSDPLVEYPSVDAVWDRFMKYFAQVVGMIMYEGVFGDYYRQALEEFEEDNVQYIELRSLFSGIYDLDGKTYGAEKALHIYTQVTADYVKEHPEFSGAKFIYSGIRAFPAATIRQEVKDAMVLRQRYPNSLLGYDLVGQEDPNHSLLFYRDDLLYPSQQTPPTDLPYFFHTAETNWQGTETDYNLIDAILLNTTRIGHGYGLAKHPTLATKIRERGIAIEVNPISNQLLGLVKDPRNHGMVPLMADNFPVVISSDDPTTWEAGPLSHDFYVAFMNMCGEDTGLSFLKQLAINSIQYSAMNNDEKEAAMRLWNKKWNTFINKAVNTLKHDSIQFHSEDQCSADSPCP